MIYTLQGEIAKGSDNFIVLDVNGVGYKVFVAQKAKEVLAEGTRAKLFTHYYLRENGAEIYGFPSREELGFFELLISVSGVGPKSALSVLDTASLSDLSAAIQEERPDLLTQAAGIGKKTAERIVIELRGKVASITSSEVVEKMEKDADLLETLVALGFKRPEAKSALSKLGDGGNLEARLKEALKILNSKK